MKLLSGWESLLTGCLRSKSFVRSRASHGGASALTEQFWPASEPIIGESRTCSIPLVLKLLVRDVKPGQVQAMHRKGPVRPSSY